MLSAKLCAAAAAAARLVPSGRTFTSCVQFRLVEVVHVWLRLHSMRTPYYRAKRTFFRRLDFSRDAQYAPTPAHEQQTLIADSPSAYCALCAHSVTSGAHANTLREMPNAFVRLDCVRCECHLNMECRCVCVSECLFAFCSPTCHIL